MTEAQEKVFRGWKWLFCTWLLLAGATSVLAAVQPAIPKPDARYKADILVIVAHPDDDTAISTYLARAVLDEGKRVAVIMTNRGSGGPNAVGQEQSKALAAVREIEARRSLAARGVTNVWFLNGRDTPTQDVLHSLETVGHGAALEDVVRLIRLTQPDAVLTWLPAYVAGENHGDHQAAGVIAVEAFDLAGNPTAFPEQVNPPRNHFGVGQYGEGLRPWQPKKLYFFSDASHPEFLKGHGPTYLASDISKSQKIPYSEINQRAWKDYATQVDFDQKTLQYFTDMPEYVVLGKSLVPASVGGDIWDGVGQGAVAYAPQAAFRGGDASGISLEMGGPWAFYQRFYRAHGLSSIAHLVPLQTALSTDHQLWTPLLLQNHTGTAADITIHPTLPAGWTGDVQDRTYHLEPGESYPVQLFYTAPEGQDLPSPQTLRWSAMSGGTKVGDIHLSVYLEFNGVPQ